MRRSLALWLLLPLALASVAPAQNLYAEPSGRGYVAEIVAWLPKGNVAEFDLDALRVRPSERLYAPEVLASAPLALPGHGRGVVRLVGTDDRDQAEPILVKMPMARLPDFWGGATALRFEITRRDEEREGGWTRSDASLALIVPWSLPRPPRAEPGQRLLALPCPALPALTLPDGNAIAPSRRGYRVVTLVAPREGGWEATLEGVGAVRVAGDPMADASLSPIADEHLGEDPQPLAGKTMWAYPDAVRAENATATLHANPVLERRAVRVRGVYRLWRSRSVVLTGSGNRVEDAPDGGLRSALHPLLVVVEPLVAPRVRWSTTFGPDAPAVPRRVKEDPRTYSLFTVIAADGWHLDRLLSATDPRADFRTAPLAVRRAFAKGELAYGATYRQTAWFLGWPDLALAREEIERRRLVSWPYPSIVMEDTASFRDGRFLGYSVYPLP